MTRLFDAPDLPATEVGGDYQRFRNRLFIAILNVAMVFALLFALLHDLGINPLTDLHARVNYAYAAVSLLIRLLLKRHPTGLRILVPLFLFVSHLTFSSALINVVDDQFRAIWFYLLVLVAYMLGNPLTGVITTIAALATLLGVHLVVEPGFSAVTMTSILIGLLVLSLIAYVFTDRAIHYARLVEKKNLQLEQLASEDPLTGIMNARSYYEVGPRLFELAKRRNHHFILLYIDIDHFKQINDRYGHYCGDQVLIAITRTIARLLRKSDLFARIGGEEFCIILPETELEGGLMLAEKIRHAIETTAIPVNGDTLYPTTSIGVAAMGELDQEIWSLQARADENLYRAKRSGRNCVIAT